MLASRPSSILAARGGAARPRAVVPRRSRACVRVRAVLDVTTATWEKEVLKVRRLGFVWVVVGTPFRPHTLLPD